MNLIKNKIFVSSLRYLAVFLLGFLTATILLGYRFLGWLKS